MKFTQTITLISIDNIPVTPITKHELIDDSESDADYEYEEVKLITPAKRGRKPLTPQQKDVSNILKREYFKNYYVNNPDKYKYEQYDHSNSCVYKLTNIKTNKIYIGSTILPLSIRLKRHQTCLRNPKNSTYLEMAHYGIADWTIEPIIKVPLQNNTELNFLETIYISHHHENVFNKNKKYSNDVIKSIAKLFPVNYLPKGLEI